MASFYFDGNKRRIYEVPTNATYTLSSGYRIYTPTGVGDSWVRFDIQKDLWSRFQDWVSINSWSYLAFSRTGGGFRGYDQLNNPVYQTNDYRLLTSIGWRIVPANYPHELILRGNLFTDDSSSLFDVSRITANGVMARLEGFDSLQTHLISTGGNGGSINPQTIRDALKLAPTPGEPAEGSIDSLLEIAKDQAVISATNTQV